MFYRTRFLSLLLFFQLKKKKNCSFKFHLKYFYVKNIQLIHFMEINLNCTLNISVLLKTKEKGKTDLTSDSNVKASPCSVKRSLFCKLSR